MTGIVVQNIERADPAVIADLVDVTRMHTADPEHRVPHLAFQPDQLHDTPILAMEDVRVPSASSSIVSPAPSRIA